MSTVPSNTPPSSPLPSGATLAGFYTGARARVTELVAGLGDTALATPTAACPGWSVADVVAHLAAVAEDVVAGRLTGPPSDEQTAAQVARFRGQPIGAVLAAWEVAAPGVEEAIASFDVWPAVLDAVAHEQDIRGTLGRPGGRDGPDVWAGSERMLRALAPPVPMRVTCEDLDITVGPEGANPLELRTTRFEALRWRLGRRSRAQMAAFDWSGDPEPVLDHLVIFGPAASDILE